MKLTLEDLDRAWVIIRKIAADEGTTPDVVRREMAAAIDAAWSSVDPGVRAMQERLFQMGKPSVEFFLLRISKEV